MDIRINPIPSGSFECRVWVNGRKFGDRIDTVCNLLNVGDGVCEVSLVKGVLRAEAQLLIGLKAFDHGFHTLKVRRPDKFDFPLPPFSKATGVDSHGMLTYEVDLIAASLELGADALQRLREAC